MATKIKKVQVYYIPETYGKGHIRIKEIFSDDTDRCNKLYLDFNTPNIWEPCSTHVLGKDELIDEWEEEYDDD